jgi:hypothetical protein
MLAGRQETGRKADRQTSRQADRQAGSQTGRQAGGRGDRQAGGEPGMWKVIQTGRGTKPVS